MIGADILQETDKWYRWDDLVALAPPIVIGRAGHPLPAGSDRDRRGDARNLGDPGTRARHGRRPGGGSAVAAPRPAVYRRARLVPMTAR